MDVSVCVCICLRLCVCLSVCVCLNRNYSLLQVRSTFRNEYDILSGLPPHDNIVKLFAFFYDRPKAYPKLRQCGEGMALCMLMEQLAQNMQEHINSLRRANGPMVSDFSNTENVVRIGRSTSISNCKNDVSYHHINYEVYFCIGFSNHSLDTRRDLWSTVPLLPSHCS